MKKAKTTIRELILGELPRFKAEAIQAALSLCVTCRGTGKMPDPHHPGGQVRCETCKPARDQLTKVGLLAN